MPIDFAKLNGPKGFGDVNICERTRTVFSSGGNTLFLYCESGRSGCGFLEISERTDRDDVVLVPL